MMTVQTAMQIAQGITRIFRIVSFISRALLETIGVRATR
jgi:hypothetical protein